jgi:hypothetical protein
MYLSRSRWRVALHYLEQRGIIRLSRGQIVILDREGLKASGNGTYYEPEAPHIEGKHGAPSSGLCYSQSDACSYSTRSPRTPLDRLRHKRTVPLRFLFNQRRSDRQLQHGGVLTFAQLRQ